MHQFPAFVVSFLLLHPISIVLDNGNACRACKCFMPTPFPGAMLSPTKKPSEDNATFSSYCFFCCSWHSALGIKQSTPSHDEMYAYAVCCKCGYKLFRSRIRLRHQSRSQKFLMDSYALAGVDRIRCRLIDKPIIIVFRQCLTHVGRTRQTRRQKSDCSACRRRPSGRTSLQQYELCT